MDPVIITEVSPPAPEANPETAPEVAETIAGASTEIATIEANRDVAIAEIRADVEREAIHQTNELVSASREELMQCQKSLESLTQITARLEAELTETRSILSQLQASQTSPLQNSVESEATPGNQEAPVEVARKKKPLRWI